MSAVQIEAAPTMMERFAALAAEGLEPNARRFLRFQGLATDAPIELQALCIRSGRFDENRFAHCANHDEVVKLLTEADRFNAQGVYFIANAIDEAITTREESGKWHAMRKNESTTDTEITHRYVLPIDVDAVRVKKISSTDEQVVAALAVAESLRARLLASVPEAAIGEGMSGNGGYTGLALAAIPETREVEAVVKGILAALDQLFTTDAVAIDTSVCDAKRLVPAFGTVKRKGSPKVAKRPHRRSAFTCADKVERLGLGDLEVLLASLRLDLTDEQNAVVDKAMGKRASASQKTSAPRGTASSSHSSSEPDVFALAKACDVTDVCRRLGLVDGDHIKCPGCDTAGDSSVAIVGNGLKCSHNRCADKGFGKGFRTTVDLVVEVRGCSSIEAVRQLGEWFGFEVPRREKQQDSSSQSASSPSADKSKTETLRKTAADWKTPAARARSLGGVGKRLAFGFDTLDKATRGGLPPGKVLVPGGAPGAGKTTLVAAWGVGWAQQGHHVAILASDEDADGLLVRIGQNFGLSRDLLEAGDPEAREALAMHLEALPNLMLVDADEEQAVLEDVSAELHRGAAGKETVFIVDSIQTVRVVGMENADGPRSRIDMVMAALKREAKQRGHRVIATCELARGAYRSQNAAERTDDLAAFKESGGIEYGATMAMVLRSVSGDGGLVDVTIPKNRLGQKLPFRMELNFARASFREVDMPAEGTDSAVEKMKARVLEVVSKAIEPIKSKNELVRRTKGKKKVVGDAVDELLEEEKLAHLEGAYAIGSRGSQAVPGTTAVGGPVPGSHPYKGEPIRGTTAHVGNQGE